jgi:ankyrin repeat protein
MSSCFFDAKEGGSLLEKYVCDGGLQAAAMLGAVKPVELLLEQGLQYSDKNHYGNTALHIASFADQVDFLKNVPSDVLSSEKDIQNKDLDSPLMVAIMEYSKDVAKFWLDQDADVSLTNADGLDAYALAEQTGQDEIRDLIEDQEAVFSP